MSFAVTQKSNEAVLGLLRRLPPLGVRSVDYAAPKIRFSQVLLPIAEMLAIKCSKFRRHPRFRMDAIRDTGNGHLVHRNARPHIFPERTAHFTVQFTDPIRVAAEAQCKDGHTERLVGIEACVPK